MSFVPPEVALPIAQQNIAKALALDPNSANSHYVNAAIAVWTEWDWEKGEQAFLTALKLNPNNALCRMFYAHLLMILKRPDEALHHANLAHKLDPLRPFILGLHAVVLTNAGDHSTAIDQAEKALTIEPDHFFAKSFLEAEHWSNGDYIKSMEEMKFCFSMIYGKNDHELLTRIDNTFKIEGYKPALELIINALEGLNESEKFSTILGMWYLRMDDYNQALKWFEIGYEAHHPNMPYISTNISGFQKLAGHPKYTKLIEKMNLPTD